MNSPAVRVYLLTYRRPAMLRRAVESLLGQSFQDWVCELHNDDPLDSNPAELVRAVGDPRLQLAAHEVNLGAVQSFNLCWGSISEPYMSILEDDNWWEPHFLSVMIGFMNANPEVPLAWANMRKWQELPDGKWRKEQTIWPEESKDWTLWHSPTARQLLEPLHSQGAMLVRVGSDTMVAHPPETPLFMIEAARERRIGLPIALNREICANFALTRATSRGEDLVQKIGGQILLARDYFRRIDASSELICTAWRQHWWSGRYALRAIVLACVLNRDFRALVGLIGNAELWRCFAWFALHPALTLKAVRYSFTNVDLSAFLAGTDLTISTSYQSSGQLAGEAAL